MSIQCGAFCSRFSAKSDGNLELRMSSGRSKSKLQHPDVNADVTLA